ncbi:MAG: 4Fe-4S binding protein [Actinobacteria bacterium]|nr:4Fe-4S binding protein [Actinomycetota bacterium]MBU1945119.1 4Fe-4S binding protein [Actinomycetota bacterium]MBU2686430.1 4Fe-4S binding protein [Actinomycetota bacterium]
MTRKAPIERGTAKSRRLWLKGMGLGYVFTRVPLVPKVHPWLNPRKTDMRWVPINQDIETPPGTAVPTALLDRFIEEASHRVIYHVCGCREAFGCTHYPQSIGCLLMGDAAMDSRMNLCSEVGVDEAKEHAGRAIAAGLVPLVGKARVDSYIFGIKDRARLMTVCFCCECCCWLKYGRSADPEVLDSLFPRMRGVSIEVSDACEGCGTCLERCYLGAIDVSGGRAVMSGLCRACGRCAAACPNGAISVSVDDPAFLEREYERITTYVKHV